VFIFKEDEEEEIELPFTEEELKEKFDGKLEKEMKGPTYEVLSKLLKVKTINPDFIFIAIVVYRVTRTNVIKLFCP
jgi:hypothetical protein